MFIVKFILWILTAFCWWKIFEKAQIKGWKAFIPFYCDYTRFGLANKKWLYFPFLILSIIEGVVNIVYSALAALDLADSLLENVSLNMDLQFLFWTRIILTIIVVTIEIMVGIIIARKYGKEPLFGIGLGILPVVFAPILAFDRSVYHEEKSV
ncbi:MAG: hypothetical protein E7283_01740 [Lachnospiraceae bacterium]|nr:hypothetical protein [Lachnospiraceae bacterium]